MAIYPKFGLSICAGIGSFDLGLELAFPEAVTACFVEREVAAVEVLVARMEEGSLSSAPIYSDLLTFDGRPWRGLIHFCIAGLPCQPYSVAGRQLGHEDERAIWPAFIRVVGEVLPEVVFLENVPAFLGYFRPIGNELQRMGYVVEEPLLLTASECGASHRRERFFAMAYRPRRGLRELWQPSWRSGLAHGGDEELVHASRDERNGSHGEAGSRRGVCETGNGVADSGDGLLQEQGRGPEGRDGAGPADPVLADTENHNGWGRDGGAKAGTRQGGLGWRGPSGSSPDMADANSMGAIGESGIVRSASAAGDGEGAERQRNGDAAGYGGIDVGDADKQGLEGREQRGSRLSNERATGQAGYTGLPPLFAPGPGATELWQRILAEYPWLAPALSEEEAQRILCGVFARTPPELDFEDRTDRLRSLGNLAQSLQVAVACTELSARIREVNL